LNQVPVSGTHRITVPLGLCLGGMDPSAGAGLLRDALTLGALGVHPMAVCTAETVQNGAACLQIQPPSDPLPALEALEPHLSGPDPWGAKLGLCALDSRRFRELAAYLARLAPPVRIWDPIQAPTSGVGLHSAPGLRAMAEVLLAGGGWVVAPNLPEAAALSGLPAETGTEARLRDLARPLLDLGAEAVWLKGGHGAPGHVEDFWITRDGAASLGARPRLPGDRRGTGCTLASAWLAFRLRGLDGPSAATEAAHFLRRHWEPGLQPGAYGRPCFAPGAP
jgi:hydroxymethylpyrimidine/phosphomethylpyrimidine kinase